MIKIVCYILITLHSQLGYHQDITPQMESEDLCVEFANSLLREAGETHPYPDDMGDLNTLYHDICGGGGGEREPIPGPSNRENFHEMLRDAVPLHMVS